MSLFEVFAVVVMTVLLTLIVRGIFSSKPVGFMWHWSVAYFTGAMLTCFIALVANEEGLFPATAASDQTVQQVVQPNEPDDQPPVSRSPSEFGTASPSRA